ncbi:MAG: hypothetical protein ABFD79_02185 [Phycisphaerales bacterium]
MAKIKYICKSLVVLIFAIIFDTFLAWAVNSMLMYLESFNSKIYYYLYLLSNQIVELCVVFCVIGILGGRWIGKPIITGFILSGIYYIGWYMYPMITTRPPKFDALTVFTLLGIPIIIVLSGLTYAKFAKTKDKIMA